MSGKELSIEKYLQYFSSAAKHGDNKAMKKLFDDYPDLLAVTNDEKCMQQLRDPADDENLCDHPIVLNTMRMSEKRVMDMVAYLLCREYASESYKSILRLRVPYHEVFNYRWGRYQRDYFRKALWDSFFLAIPELHNIVKKRGIHSIEELECRAAEYFSNLETK